MNPFRGLTITHRLILVFVTLIGGFLAVALAYQNLLHVEHENDALIEHSDSFTTLVALVKNDIGMVDKKANTFLRTKDIGDAEDFFADNALYQLQGHLKQLAAVEHSPKIQGLLSLMQNAWTAYGNAFEATVNAQVLVGLDEDKGLQGDMRSSSQDIERSLQNFNQTPLMVALLQIRRYEKNFIIRKNFDSIRQVRDKRAVFTILLDQAKMPELQRDAIARALVLYGQAFDILVKAAYHLEARIEDTETALQVVNELSNDLETQGDTMSDASDKITKEAGEQASLLMSTVMIPVGIIIMLMLGSLALSLRRSLTRLQDTVQRVHKGDLSARTQLQGRDELHSLGRAFDTMLSERMTTLAKAESENERINESIIGIIETVARMSQRDLTVKAVVAEDITGTISDALNLMADETTGVLVRIRAVAQAVEQAANAVNEQAETVNEVATQERRLVQKSAEGLLSAGQALTQLAQSAQDANIKADTAMARTRQALMAVTTSVQGIDRIRDIIRETEKRIKRLGERSQEITGAVNLINAISERTHILALNASMHAASAGEAGRGFAVVADEVQRLAESSQKATSDIAVMVNAIREETSDTLETMNRLIAQVAEGTRQAQDAGQRMRETEVTTADLVKAVQEMAEGAGQQAQGALELRKQSQIIVRSTEQTSMELKEQSTYTLRLMEYANTLREAVAVFRLPI